MSQNAAQNQSVYPACSPSPARFLGPSRRVFRSSATVLLFAPLAAILCLPSEALANDDEVACWYRNQSFIDEVMHPAQRGDNEFFTRSDVPPNLMWILDNSGSMQTLSCNGECDNYSRCEGGFSSNGRSFFLNRGYTPYTNDANAGDAFDKDFCTGKNPRGFNGQDGCYKPGLVYSHYNNGSCGAWPSGSNPVVWSRYGNSDTGSTPTAYCRSRYGTSNTTTARRNRENCENQLINYGYHPGTSATNPVFMGAALNIYPPKFVIARRVLKDLVMKTNKIRQGLMIFNNGGGGGPSGYGNLWNGGRLLVEFGPECNMFFPPVEANYDLNKEVIIREIDKIKFWGGTPLGETMMSACQYFSGNQNRFKNEVMVHNSKGVGFADSGIPNRQYNQDPICLSCQKNFTVMITDGFPSIDNQVPCKLRNYDRDCKEGLQDSPNCGTVNTKTCPNNERRTYSSIEGTDYFDDVAAFCYEEDLRPDMPGKQNTIVHTVGFDIDAPILADAARQGGGIYMVANDADELRSALTTVLQNIESRATSFSVASVTTVQTRGSTYAFVPRFRPSMEELWEGHLYRLTLFNEFAAGCTDADTSGEMTEDKLKRNPNGNEHCSDVYLMDANGDFVGEDEEGRFVVLDHTKPWDDEEGWPIKQPIQLAKPHWDAGEKLAQRNLVNNPRKIYTAIDLNKDGEISPDEQIEFTVANAAVLAPSLAVGGINGSICTEMAARRGLGPYTNSLDCTRDLIRFIRGENIFNEFRDGNRTQPRPKILGDIFHSAPTLVTPPPPAYLCDLGIVTQCSFSLYSDGLTPGGMEAYEEWAADEAGRDRFVLVGSNSGMVHAFHAGSMKTGDDPETGFVEPEDHIYHDVGTGEELWAFIPPNLLPKLSQLAVRTGEHKLFVDGTAMVKDVWVESNTAGEGQGRKDKDEFHTVAVVGQRQGGRDWLGLDVSNPTKPQFLWSWPLPGSPESMTAGESWNEIAPAAPPIGPVAIADAQGPLDVEGVKAREVWSVWVGGGFDPNFMRGRSINALNVWTGKPLWRFAAEDATDGSDPRRHLFPVPAPVALLDIGPGAIVEGKQDGLFDTAVVGDVMGQVWTLRFHSPGVDTDGDGLMDNWYGARSFVQFKGDSIRKRSAFFQLAEASVDPTSGVVRAHLGSGDRTNIRDAGGGNCGPSNIGACLRKNCQAEIHSGSGSSHERIGTSQMQGRWRHQPNASTFTTNSISAPASDASNTCSVPVQSSYQVSLTCGPIVESYSWNLNCNPAGDTLDSCSQVNHKPAPAYSLIQSPNPTQNSRFYTFALFGGSNARIPFNTLTQAKAYDAASLSESDLTQMSVTGNDTGIADEKGFFIEYANTDERTSSSAAVLGGCVAWNTLNPGDRTAACGSNTGDRGHLYRAHFATGTAACGDLDGSERYVSRKALVAPPGLTPTVSLNPETGEVRYNLLSVEPGSAPMQTSVGERELSGGIYWLDVTREVHQCRHSDAACR